MTAKLTTDGIPPSVNGSPLGGSVTSTDAAWFESLDEPPPDDDDPRQGNGGGYDEWSDGPSRNGWIDDQRARAFDRAVEAQQEQLRIRETALARHRAQTITEQAASRAGTYPAQPRSSYQQMTDPDALAEAVILDEWTGAVVQRRGQMARLLADSKGGKTLVGLDWSRCALTGDRWLGRFQTVPVAEGAKVGFIDPELDKDFTWYMRQVFNDLDQPIVDQLVRIDLVELKALGWTWSSEADRLYLADQLRGCERIFADSVLSLLPGGNGTRESSHSLDDVGEFLDQFRAFQQQIGASEVLMGIHRPAGGAEKSFGSIQWDAKFQALWSIRVEETNGMQIRKLRGYPGRAGTGFPEAEVVQTDGKGRISYRTEDFYQVALRAAEADKAKAQREAEAQAKAVKAALDLLPDVLGTLWTEVGSGTRPTPPSKKVVVDKISERLKADTGRGLSGRHVSAFWEAVQDSDAVIEHGGIGKQQTVHLPGWEPENA